MRLISTLKYKQAGLAALPVKEDAKVDDNIILRQAIVAEYDAVSLYEQLAKSTTNEKVKSVLLSVAQEEKVHIGEFEALLDKTDSQHKESVEDGKGEEEE